MEKAKAGTRCPLPILPKAAVCGAAVTLLLTSASFQSPGMQKDSSRSLPHSSKIRSSEEGEQRLHRGKWRPGKHATPSPSPVNTEVTNPWGSSTQLFQAPRHCGACSIEAFARHAPGSFTDHSCPLREELSFREGLGLPGTEGFLGARSFRAKPGWLVIPRETEPAM